MADVVFVASVEKRELKALANGTMILATKLLQAGIDTEIVRFGQYNNTKESYPEFVEEVVSDLAARAPRCVSFYTLWPYYHIMLRMAAELKARRPEISIVLGGPQASITAQATMEAMPFVDYICTGEGENTVVPFFRAVLEADAEQLGKIPGLYHRVGGQVCRNTGEVVLCDLNALPYWDERLYRDYIQDTEESFSSDSYYMPIDAGRGCPYSCTFCCSSRFWRRTYRLKSPERIVEDILFYRRKFGIRGFWFSHDAFTTNKKLVEAVCDKLIEENLDIKWRCTARVNCIDEELVLKMKRAGMTRIEMGVETGSERMQKVINKKLDLDRVRAMASFLLKNDIHVSLFFMYGFPEETEEDLNQTLQLLFDLIDQGVQYTSMTFCKFNPATAITEQYFDELVLKPEITVLTRDLWQGYAEELPMIRENKALFPFFYHLDTPLRNNYQYLIYLHFLYRQFPFTARYVRKLYENGIHFYQEFFHYNRHYLEKEITETSSKELYKDLLDLWYRMIEPMHLPYERQLKALLRYDYHMQQAARSKEDMSITETYDFSYVDFKMKLPLEQYSNGRTEILIEKRGEKRRVQVLNLIHGE